MKKGVIASLVILASMATGVVAHVNMSAGNVSKASKNDASNVKVTQESKSISIDEAYQDNQEEEKYIADLVSKMTNKEVSTKDWQVCLDYLESNYDKLIADKSVDKEKVDSYVEGYQYLEQELAMEESDTEEETGVYNPNYDVSKVEEYIAEYWDEYNEEYPCYKGYGGDCANFVSQCLAAGGMQMRGTNASSFSNWFCRTSVTEEFSKVSSTWRGAEAFASYWKKNALEYRDFGPEYFENRVAFDEVYEYANVGDAVSYINSNGRPYHTVIVALKNRDNDREIRFAAHTSFQNERSVFEYCSGGTKTARIYKMSKPSAELEASYNYDMTDDEVQKMFKEGPYAAVEGQDDNTNNNEANNNTNTNNQRRSFWQRLFGR